MFLLMVNKILFVHVCVKKVTIYFFVYHFKINMLWFPSDNFTQTKAAEGWFPIFMMKHLFSSVLVERAWLMHRWEQFSTPGLSNFRKWGRKSSGFIKP